MTDENHDALRRTDAELATIDRAEPETILMPLTGELVRADDPSKVAEAIEMLRDHKRKVDGAIAAFTAAAAEISKQKGTKTIHIGGGASLKISDGGKVEWDVTELVKLVGAGLPLERYEDLVTETVAYKVDGNVARQIAGSNPAYKKIIEQAKKRTPGRVSANVVR